MKKTLLVCLNGTDKNPHEIYGCSQNPFPQHPEYGGASLRLQKLGGPPIPNTDYIREVLKGFSKEFIELCCKRFKPGEYVKFEVYFDDGKPY